MLDNQNSYYILIFYLIFVSSTLILVQNLNTLNYGNLNEYSCDINSHYDNYNYGTIPKSSDNFEFPSNISYVGDNLFIFIKDLNESTDLGGVLIQIFNAENENVSSKYSDGNGFGNFTILNCGTYNITLSKPGFQDNYKTFNIVDPNESLFIDIFLEKQLSYNCEIIINLFNEVLVDHVDQFNVTIYFEDNGTIFKKFLSTSPTDIQIKDLKANEKYLFNIQSHYFQDIGEKFKFFYESQILEIHKNIVLKPNYPSSLNINLSTHFQNDYPALALLSNEILSYRSYAFSNNNTIVFNDLPIGNYRIKIFCPNFTDYSNYIIIKEVSIITLNPPMIQALNNSGSLNIIVKTFGFDNEEIIKRSIFLQIYNGSGLKFPESLKYRAKINSFTQHTIPWIEKGMHFITVISAGFESKNIVINMKWNNYKDFLIVNLYRNGLSAPIIDSQSNPTDNSSFNLSWIPPLWNWEEINGIINIYREKVPLFDTSESNLLYSKSNNFSLSFQDYFNKTSYYYYIIEYKSSNLTRQSSIFAIGYSKEPNIISNISFRVKYDTPNIFINWTITDADNSKGYFVIWEDGDLITNISRGMAVWTNNTPFRTELITDIEKISEYQIFFTDAYYDLYYQISIEVYKTFLQNLAFFVVNYSIASILGLIILTKMTRLLVKKDLEEFNQVRLKNQ
nr:hypothetical protein [Candidatus Prometheoarchaeum syntrophicum]QEE16052.1 hypothetical protein DSAG12_01880 [Candidatus Prometheoarchaeum syntrophicum]